MKTLIQVGKRQSRKIKSTHMWQTLATVAVVCSAVYGEVHGVHYLWVGALFMCGIIW